MIRVFLLLVCVAGQAIISTDWVPLALTIDNIPIPEQFACNDQKTSKLFVGKASAIVCAPARRRLLTRRRKATIKMVGAVKPLLPSDGAVSLTSIETAMFVAVGSGDPASASRPPARLALAR